MNRRDFLRTLVSVAVLPSIPLSAVASVRSRWNIAGTITSRTASAGVLNQQFLQKRHLAKMWMFAKSYGSSKGKFIENLGAGPDPTSMYNYFQKMFVTNFKEIEMLAMERMNRRCQRLV